MEPKKEYSSLLGEFDRNLRRIPDDVGLIRILNELKQRSGPVSLKELNTKLDLGSSEGARLLSKAAYDGLIHLDQDQNSDALVSLTLFGRRVAAGSES